MARVNRPVRVPSETRRVSLCYRFVLPLLTGLNLLLGLILIFDGAGRVWYQLLEVATGALCCVIAGWLCASLWSKAYWSRTIERQVDSWRLVANAFFRWLEDAPVSVESLARLQGSLDEAVAQNR